MPSVCLDPAGRVLFALGQSRVKASPSLRDPLTARQAQTGFLLRVEAEDQAPRTGLRGTIVNSPPIPEESSGTGALVPTSTEFTFQSLTVHFSIVNDNS